MLNLKSPFYLLASTAIVLFAGQVDRAYASPATGAIAGLADPRSQIVVTSVEDGKVIGVVAKCDGT